MEEFRWLMKGHITLIFHLQEIVLNLGQIDAHKAKLYLTKTVSLHTTCLLNKWSPLRIFLR